MDNGKARNEQWLQRFWTVSMLALALAPAAAGQEAPAGERVAEELQITAVDLSFEAAGPTGTSPSRLNVGDVEVLEDGVSVPVVGLARLGSSEGAEPWRLVLYFDRSLSDAATTQAAALQLGERARRLVELGTVEIVVADPVPDLILPATRDAAAVENALSRVLLDLAGQDELVGMRRQATEAVLARQAGKAPPADSELPPELTAGEIAAAAVAEEVALAERSLASLLLWSADHAFSGPRALLLVGSGFDLDPAAFHSQYAGKVPLPPAREQLTQRVSDTAKAVASYGWTVFPLAFRDLGPSPLQPSQQFDRFSQMFRQKADSDTGRAKPLINVPIYHDRRRRAEPEQRSALLEPLEPLSTLAFESGGRLVEKADKLDAAFLALDSRFRVTVQVARRFDGRMRALELSARSLGYVARGRSWVRSGTPAAVSEARVRGILAGQNEAGDLALSARLLPADPGQAERKLSLALDLTRRGSRPPFAERTQLRLTLAWGRGDEPPRYEFRLLPDQDLSGTAWNRDERVQLPADTEWLVVVVEDLASGLWGARDLEP